jgi:hypothetical protein
MKKIVFLEVSDIGPNDNHKNMFLNNDLCDFYYVTWKKKVNDPCCLGYFPKSLWAENRQKLFELVPKIYDYYCFMDDDLIFSSLTNNSFVKQLLIDMENTNAVALSPYYEQEKGQKRFPELQPCSYFIRYFQNPCCKVYGKDYLNYFFPLNLNYGAAWGCGMFLGMSELIFTNKIVCSHNIKMFNPPECRGDYSNALRDSERAYNELGKELTNHTLFNNRQLFVDYILKLTTKKLSEQELKLELIVNTDLYQNNNIFMKKYNQLLYNN